MKAVSCIMGFLMSMLIHSLAYKPMSLQRGFALHPFLEDPLKTPSDKMIDDNLLSVCMVSFKNDLKDSQVPERFI